MEWLTIKTKSRELEQSFVLDFFATFFIKKKVEDE
jgi:hypothetical protein